MRGIVYILVFSLIGYSCSVNELPEDLVDTEVVFYAEGSAGNEVFFLEAGPGDIVVEADASLIEGELSLFSVEFFNAECEECDEEVFIEISGSGLYSEGLTVSEMLPLGIYDVESEGYEHIVYNSFELNFPSDDFEVLDLQGFGVFNENGVYDLGPGFYEFDMELDDVDCQGSVNGGFFIGDEGEICLNLVHFIEIEDEIYLDFSDFLGELLFINVNDAEFIQIEEDLISLEELLEFTGDEELETLSVFPTDISDCFSNPLTYIFEAGFSFCEIELEVEPVMESIERTPLTVAISYSDGEGNEYTSSDVFTEDFFELIDLESYGVDPLGRESYRAQVEFSASLVNTEDESDILMLNINEAFIPIVVE